MLFDTHHVWSLSVVENIYMQLSTVLDKLCASYYICWPRTFCISCDVSSNHPPTVHHSMHCRRYFTWSRPPHPHCLVLCPSDLGRPNAHRRCQFHPPGASRQWSSGDSYRSCAGDSATSHTVFFAASQCCRSASIIMQIWIRDLKNVHMDPRG